MKQIMKYGRAVTVVLRRTLMYDLTGFQRDLLYAVAGLDEPHRMAIKEEMEKYYESEVNHGRLYPNLDEMVEKGLVNKGQKDRRTNEYQLTDRGRREMKNRREWEKQHCIAGDLTEIVSGGPERTA
jgi:DNA-binding PadR family transcriptional regulator